jgi:hypothetical protein
VKARLVSCEDDEGGVAVVEINGYALAGMSCFGYGRSAEEQPHVGDVIDLHLICQGDFGSSLDWQLALSRNVARDKQLKRSGVWSYEVRGQVASVSHEDDLVFVDCGVVVLPIPWSVPSEAYIGEFVGFFVQRLDLWLADLR